MSGGQTQCVYTAIFSSRSDQFKAVAPGTSANVRRAVGRIQHPWLDRESKYLPVSDRAFEATPMEQAFEQYVTVLTDAAEEVLLMRASGQASAERYTERGCWRRKTMQGQTITNYSRCNG